MPTEPIKIPLIGFEIERRLDLLVFVALILALLTAGAQVRGYLRGVEMKLYPPELVALILEKNPVDKQPYLRIAARMAYTNAGWVGYNDAVYREEVEFFFGEAEENEPYRQRWHSEHQVTTDSDGQLLLKYLKEAGPFPVAGGSSVSREIYFAPFPEQCSNDTPGCDEYSQFISARDALGFLESNEVMHLTFKSSVLSQKAPLTAGCKIDIRNERLRWGLLFFKLITLPCLES